MSKNAETSVRNAMISFLQKLTEKAVCGVDELPAGIDVDVLRCLDSEGWIEARYTVMQNVQQYPLDPTPPVPVASEWFSPITPHGAANIGDWNSVISQHRRDARNHPNEVRVSERGMAELLKAKLAASAVSTISPIGTCPVKMIPNGQNALVLGVSKTLGTAQFRVINALVAVWPNRIATKDLVKSSSTESPNKPLRSLTADPDWKNVILFPGKGGHGSGYGLQSPVGETPQ